MATSKTSLTALLATVLASSIFAGQFEGWNFKGDITLQPHSQQQQLEKKSENILTHAQKLRERQQYSACMDEAQKIPPESNWYSKAQQLGFECKEGLSAALLQQAKELAAQGKYREAIATIRKIPEGEFSDTAQQLTDEWSLAMQEVAQRYCQQATESINHALSVASAIPENSPAYNRVQAQIQSWQSAGFTNCEPISRSEHGIAPMQVQPSDGLLARRGSGCHASAQFPRAGRKK
jgi:hypothetical protein